MFAIVFQQVLIMFLLMLIGFIYAKATGMRKEECNRICNILLMIVTPCLLLSNLQRPFNMEIVEELLFSLGLAAFSSIFSILAARFLFLPRGRSNPRGRVHCTTIRVWSEESHGVFCVSVAHHGGL